MATVSDDDQLKQSYSPPPATHCHFTSANTDNDDTKPLDLSKKQNEQSLNLCSKRKRSTPVSLSKRNSNTMNVSSMITDPTSSMLMPFYAMSPFFDLNLRTNQQQALQQMQTYYLQLQQKLTQK